MDKKNKIKIGLIGLGTVGSGVFKTLKSFENVEVKRIAVRNIHKKRNTAQAERSRQQMSSVRPCFAESSA